MDTYEEVTLKKALSKQGFKVQHLAVVKVHLANLILKSLRSFNESKNPEQGVLSLLVGAEILKNKGLYNQALKQLVKAKNAARKFEMNYYMFEILNREAAITLNLVEKDGDERLKSLFDEIEILKKKVQRETELRVLANKILLILNTKPLKHPNTIKAIDEIANDPNLSSLEESDSFFAKLYHFLTFAVVKRAQSDFSASSLYCQKMLELWERHPQLRAVHRRLYKAHISNYLNSCHMLGDYQPFAYWLEKFKSIPDTNYDEEMGSFKDFSQTRLLYLLNTGQLHAALEFTKEIEVGLTKYQSRMNKGRVTPLRFNVFITFFINEKYAEALDWLLTLALDDKIEARADARSLARIMRVIVHYELGHTRIIDSLRSSVYRKLKKDEQLHEFERTILDHIRKLEAVISKKELKALWQNLYQQLNGIGDKYGWNKIAGLEEIAVWAESKVLNRPYVKLMEERKQR